MITPLPEGFTVRPASMDDLEIVHELLVLCEQAQFDSSDYTPDYVLEDLRADWHPSRLNLSTDTWIVTTSQGQIIAYMDVHSREGGVDINPNSCVHPSYCGRGIGTHLLQLAELRAQQLIPTGPLRLIAWIIHTNIAAQRLIERQKFVSSNHSVLNMEIKLNEAPPIPQWPEDITIRTFIPGQDDQAVFDTIEEAFQAPFANWEEIYLHRSDFDPTMWHLALVGNQLAGAILCVPVPDMGWVDKLAVRRKWRKKGLGMALLLHAFGDLYRRGLRKVTLVVGSENPTDAKRLYERAGMHVAFQIDAYHKELRKQ
jgi:mycothiol synthase